MLQIQIQTEHNDRLSQASGSDNSSGVGGGDNDDDDDDEKHEAHNAKDINDVAPRRNRKKIVDGQRSSSSA